MKAGCRRLLVGSMVLVLAGLGTSAARAQAPTLPEARQSPGSFRSTLGPTPGAGANPFGMTPGTDPTFLGGRPGPSFPRVPTAITTPGGAMAPTPGIAAPTRVQTRQVPLYGPLDLPDEAEVEGPADGLTLDAAIDRLVRANLALEALRWQIPASRADVLTASLRANPVLYADAQLVPYGQYTRVKSGGPTQYDLNVTHPIDYSGKRQARTASARVVLNVQEALYREAVRIQVANLYTAFVDVLAARETVRYARASRIGLERLLNIYETLYRKSTATRADVARARAALDTAEVSYDDAEETYRKTRRTLAAMLNLPPAEAEALTIRGTIADLAPPPPPADELTRIALHDRPDLEALRLGIARARADVKVALASRFGDAYVLYQPYTFQNNAPFGEKSATSWALGVTVPVPIYNRNQGGVARARLNVEQTLTEVAAIEQRIATEVRDAEREYHLTREQLRALAENLLPAARRLRDDTFQLFVGGEVTAVEADNARKDYNQAVRQYRDTLIRHRRSMLLLNTAIARRVLP